MSTTTTTAATAATRDADDVRALVRWCVERGARGSGLTVALETGAGAGRGLEATRAVRAGEGVLELKLASGIVDDAKGHPESARDAMKEAPVGGAIGVQTAAGEEVGRGVGVRGVREDASGTRADVADTLRRKGDRGRAVPAGDVGDTRDASGV